MRHKSILGIKLIILLLLLFSTLGGKCDWWTGNGETPEDSTGCGHGEGHFSVGIDSWPPSSFDCNLQGSFQMEFHPSIHETYGGFNRFYFELKRGSSIHRSNYVEFDSGYWAVKPVEWGGSLPSGEYRVMGILENIQLSSTCQDSIYTQQDVNLGEVNITEFANPDKVMQIEYFCQDSDIGTIDRYGVFLSSMNTEEYMGIAFNIANTRYNIDVYDTDLTPQLIECDPYDPNYDPREIKDYIFNLKQWENEMLLCGIKGFRDPQGHYIPEVTGVTYFFNIPIPACSTGSLIAVKGCIDLVANEYKIDYNDFVTATTIHELGHQRASILHGDYHGSEFCIMKLLLIEQSGSIIINRYSNPHFCNNCINRLKNISR